MSDITVLLTSSHSTGGFPKNLPYMNGSGYMPFPAKKFQRVLETSFEAAGLEIVDGYFDMHSRYFPRNLSLLVLAIETHPDLLLGTRYNGIKTIYGQDRQIVGGIIAEKEKIGNFEFFYYDKIFVIPEWWNNGLAGRMIRAIKETKVPGVLKTSISANNGKYSGESDIVDKIGPYYFHGFGFLDKSTGEDKFPGAKSMFYAAVRRVIEQKPATSLKIKNEVTQDNNLPLFLDN